MLILDTNILSILQNKPSALRVRAEKRIAELLSPGEAPVTTIITYEEQVRGWFKLIKRARTPEKVAADYESLLLLLRAYQEIKVLPLSQVVAERAVDLRKTSSIKEMDARIAAVALVNDGTLFTQNVRDFRQIAGMKLEGF